MVLITYSCFCITEVHAECFELMFSVLCYVFVNILLLKFAH